MTIKTGPFEGLIAQQTPYQLDVTARTATGGEVHLIRTMEAVAIPVFQFGMFSDVDLSVLRPAETSLSAAACTPTATCSCRQANGSDADAAPTRSRRSRRSCGSGCRTACRSTPSVSTHRQRQRCHSTGTSCALPARGPRAASTDGPLGRAERAGVAHDFDQPVQLLDPEHADRGESR